MITAVDRVHQRLRQKQHFLHLKEADTPSSPPSQSDNVLSHLFDPGFDRRDYINEGFRQLNDPNYYEPQPTDLTPIHMDAISALVNRMTTDGELSKRQSYLLGFKPHTARFYMLPKLHKNKLPPPGHPVISGNNSPTERISQLVDHFLKPASPLGPSYIKDTTHFLQIIAEVGPLPPGCLLVTLDVSSLCTNIPNSEGIQAALEALETIRPGAQHPTNTSLIKLLELVLKSNNFTFCGRHFLQTGGTAMGTRDTPNYAITHMHTVESVEFARGNFRELSFSAIFARG